MRLFEYLSLFRIRHYVKNLFLFATLIFSKELFNPESIILSVAGFVLFCLLSSSVYILNDIVDIEEDRNHPIKKNRMLPSGRISVGTAWFWAVIFSLVSLVGSFSLVFEFGLVALAYWIINFGYTYFLKHVVIIDVFLIAAGFWLRILAGAYVIGQVPSQWLIICSFVITVFLGFCKRRHELVLLEGNAQNHRKVLEHYSPYFLDQMISALTSVVVISYLLYTISPHSIEFFGTENLIYSFPFVLYGLFRYLYLVHKKEQGGSPTQTLMMDSPLLIDILLWFTTVSMIIYL